MRAGRREPVFPQSLFVSHHETFNIVGPERSVFEQPVDCHRLNNARAELSGSNNLPPAETFSEI
jgi:hypothetical protein